MNGFNVVGTSDRAIRQHRIKIVDNHVSCITLLSANGNFGFGGDTSYATDDALALGNILDEYDEEDDYIEEKSEDEYIIEGKTPLEELEERFNITFNEEEFETLNGFMISKLDRIPGEDEEFDVDVDGYNFKILSVENKMIQSVLVTKLEETKES